MVVFDLDRLGVGDTAVFPIDGYAELLLEGVGWRRRNENILFLSVKDGYNEDVMIVVEDEVAISNDGS